jgi:cytochrome c peroxidase
MVMRNLLSYTCLLLTTAIATSCQEPQLDTVGEVYVDLPAQKFNYSNFQDTTNALSTLGRVLFYDKQLSINNTVSCASCHKQSAGFADNVKFSIGFSMKPTTRNSMPVQNLTVNNFLAFDFLSSKGTLGNTAGISSSKPATSDFFGPSSSFGQHFFWDGRESSLEKLILQPVGNHIEMGITDVQALTEKLSKAPYYEPLFIDAYNSSEITPERISKAVTAFISSINTTNTRFDQHNRSFGTENGSPLNPLELEGMLLFDSKYDCNSCHQVTSPGGYILAGTFSNIGLDAQYQDNGLENKTKSSLDAGKFKIPSLRNVVYTAPYMHDGRFENLEDVIEHYSSGIENHPNLDVRLREVNGQAKSMNISEHEKKAIVAFLHTLSDESVLTDVKFSNPFKLK